MKKLFRFGIVSLALTMCFGAGALALKEQNSKKVERTEAADYQVLMHFPGQDSADNPKVKYYYRNGDINSSFEVSVSQFQTTSPDCLVNSTIQGNSTTSWTITTTKTDYSRIIAVPVRLAISGVPAQSAVYLNSFNYSLGASSSEAKIELFESDTFTGGTGIKADVATKSSLAVNRYSGSGSNAFAYNNKIRFYNQTSSSALKAIDPFWLVLTMPNAHNNAQYSFTFTMNTQNVSDAEEVVFQVGSDTYSLSEFITNKNSFATDAVAKVLKNFTLDTALNLVKNITINLNNYTVTCSVNDAIKVSSSTVRITSSPQGGKLTTSQNVLVNVQGGTLEVYGSGQTLENTSTANGKYVISVTQSNSAVNIKGATIIKGGQYGIYGAISTSVEVGNTSSFQNQSGYGIYCIDGSAIYLYEQANVGKICMPTSGAYALILQSRDGSLSYINTTNNLEVYFTQTLSNQKTIATAVYNQSVANHIVFKSIGSGYMAKYIDSGHYIECAYFETTPTFVLTHCSVDNPNIVLSYNSGKNMTFTADRGYSLPSTISVSGINSNKYSWYQNTGYLNVTAYSVTQAVTITVNATINTEGKALVFINNNMHMTDYDPDLHVGTEGAGWCKDNTHHYYSTAKSAFNSLEKTTRVYLMTNEQADIVAAKDRLIAWATANGEEIVVQQSGEYIIQSINSRINIVPIETNNIPILVVTISLMTISVGFAILIMFKKRKTHK